MKSKFHHLILFSFIFIILSCLIVFPTFAVNQYTLSTNLYQIMDTAGYYYTAHSYSDSSGSLLWSPHQGVLYNTIKLEDDGIPDDGFYNVYANMSNNIILTRWEPLDNQAFIEYRIPLSFGTFNEYSDYTEFGFNGQFAFNVFTTSNSESNFLTSLFEVDSVFFKGYRRDGTTISSSYNYQLDFNALPKMASENNNYTGRQVRLLNLSFNFSKEDFVYLTDYINMDTLYIRIKIDMTDRSVIRNVSTRFGFTRLDINTTENNFINIIGNINNLQLKIDTLTAAVNDNFSALFDLLESANSSDQLNTIQQTIEQVNGSWDEVDEQVYSEYIEEVTSTEDKMESMGDILNSVPKPPTSNITNITNSSLILDSIDINDTKSFLSIIYEWDTLLSIMGIVVALMTISYIIFGKKE